MFVVCFLINAANPSHGAAEAVSDKLRLSHQLANWFKIIDNNLPMGKVPWLLQLALVWSCESAATRETTNSLNHYSNERWCSLKSSVTKINGRQCEEMELIWCCCHHSVMPLPCLKAPSSHPQTPSLWLSWGLLTDSLMSCMYTQ